MTKDQAERLSRLLRPVALSEVADAVRAVITSIPDDDRAKFLGLCRGVTDDARPFEFYRNRGLNGFVIGPVLSGLSMDRRSAYVFLNGPQLGGAGIQERLSCVAHEAAHVVLEHLYQSETFGDDEALRRYQVRKLDEKLGLWRFAAFDTPEATINPRDFAEVVRLNVGRCGNNLPIPPPAGDAIEENFCLLDILREIERLVNDERFTKGDET